MHPLLEIYHPEIPDFLAPFFETPELQRLRDVGMNCGCEYTRFPRFRHLPPYSRYRHSVGAALITWHFTRKTAPTLAALFHDVASPAFSHSVDFLRGDYLRQEATEAGTEEILRRSAVIPQLLERLGLTVDDVKDYHRYPIADNDAPRLSADRLEYTLGNLLGYGYFNAEELTRFYQDLRVAAAPDGAPELAFSDAETARDFAFAALACSKIYVSDEDRYAMQRLAEVLRDAIARGVLSERTLWTTEPEVIAALEHDAQSRLTWEEFRALHRMVPGETAPDDRRRIVFAKKRHIDPLVAGQGRVTELDAAFRAALREFLDQPQERWICGE